MAAQNEYRVPTKAWRRWPALARQVFNATFSTMREGQDLLRAPSAPEQSARAWRVTCWNASWIAADACARGIREQLKALRKRA